VGQKNINGKEGTYIDAEDGILSGNTIAQGSVDSVVGLHLDIKGMSQKKAYYWLTAGAILLSDSIWISRGCHRKKLTIGLLLAKPGMT
jgi:GH15 family glucan-1,4-alpha-glucosidase